MHLVYIDESGNTGTNLDDPQQPVFVLCAMIVAEDHWQNLETELRTALDELLPQWRDIEGFEVHAADLRNGRGCFEGVRVDDRISLRDTWMRIGARHGVKLIHRPIHKKRFAMWQAKEFSGGLKLNPHVPAFALLSRCVDSYLRSLPGSPRGMLISDDNKEIVKDVEKSIRALRDFDGKLRLNQIIEKGFFIDSQTSLPLQLCDLFALSLRKKAESDGGSEMKPFDKQGIAIAAGLVHEDKTEEMDVLTWFTEHHTNKKSGQGD